MLTPPSVQHIGVDPIVQGKTGDGHARRARGYRQLLLEINRVITTAFATAGLDGCVQSDLHYYLVDTTLAGHWCAVQTSLMRRLRSPQVRTYSFLAQPPDLRRMIL
jgi:hypothetical protein